MAIETIFNGNTIINYNSRDIYINPYISDNQYLPLQEHFDYMSNTMFEVLFEILDFDPNGKFAQKYFYTEIYQQNNNTVIDLMTSWKTYNINNQNIILPFKNKKTGENISVWMGPKNRKNYYPELAIHKKKNKPIKLIEKELDSHLPRDFAINAHKLNNSIIGLSQKEFITVVHFDIDNKEGTLESFKKEYNTVKKLCQFFKVPPIYLNVREDGGTHIAYKFSKVIKKKDLQEFLKVFNKNNPDITPIEITDVIRIPFCAQYTNIDLNHFKDDSLPFYETKKFEKMYIEGFLPSYSFYSMFTFIESLKTYNNSNVIDPSIIYEYSDNIPKEKEIQLYRRVYNQNKDTLIQRYNQLMILEGQRHEVMKQIASIGGIYLGKTLKELIEDTYQKNYGSKDLKKWSYTKIESWYNDCLINMKRKFSWINYHTKKENIFYSNVHLVNHIQIPKKYVNQILINLNFKNKNIEHSYRQWIEIVFKEILGMLVYDEQNKKVVNPILHYNLSRHLTKGSQFSSIYLNLLKDHYQMKNINIRKLFNAIIQLDMFKQYSWKSKNNKSIEYLNIDFIKVCKQFTLRKINKKLNIINNIILIFKNINRLSSEFKIHFNTNNMQKISMSFYELIRYKKGKKNGGILHPT